MFNFPVTRLDNEYDVLIIGSGAAGLRTGIELQKQNIACLVISKRSHDDAHTQMAAGGINAALGSLDPEDNWAIHAADTIREGHFINDARAVEIVCRSALDAVRELHDWGCPFNLTEDKKIDQRFFGAQSFRRTCFVGDRTGHAVLETLLKKAKTFNIPYLENIFIFDILKNNGKVAGALGIDSNKNELIYFPARAIVIAAGGYASVYKRSSSRHDENTGDGLALAFHAGATLMDMEMVQFHPTGMIKPESYKGKLVTEAVRGEGGRLYNIKGERFIEKYSPQMMELAPRDEVSRAIAREILAGKGSEEGGVYLDISHQDPELVKNRLPDMYERFLSLGKDITKEAMEVAPTSHYSMGGVMVNFETGETGVPGLYAVGETTAGLHGANRLGGNSLIETVVLGRLTGLHIPVFLSHAGGPPPADPREALLSWREKEFFRDREKILTEIREIMQQYAGIIRSGKTLEEGLHKLEQMKKAADKKVPATPTELKEAIELNFILLTTELILRSALIRKESRGAHFREDYPETIPQWEKNILCERDPEGQLLFNSRKPGKISDEVEKALAEEHRLNYHQLE